MNAGNKKILYLSEYTRKAFHTLEIQHNDGGGEAQLGCLSACHKGIWES
jgi:hypothetical protein